MVPNQVLPGPRNQGGQPRDELLGREPEPEDFVAQVVALARGYCTPHRAAMAAGHIKRAVQSGGELPLESGLALKRELQANLFASDDARDGLSAFVEKRSAQFSNT